MIPSPLEAEYDRWDELADDIEGTHKTQNLWHFVQVCALVCAAFSHGNWRTGFFGVNLVAALIGGACCLTRRKYVRQQRGVEASIDAKVHPVSIVHCYEDVQ